MKVGIAGGGLIGSLLAWRTSVAGAQVEVFESSKPGCSRVGAGMLGVAAETASADQQAVTKLGHRSLALWRTWLSELNAPELLIERGTILTAAGRDAAELERIAQAIASRQADKSMHPQRLDKKRLAELEPDLAHMPCGYLLPSDGYLHAESVLDHLRTAACAAGASWHDQSDVDALSPRRLSLNGTHKDYDWSCDCRGLGATAQDSKLRSVRGEIIHLHAPDVHLSRPVRLVHPRQNIYIVPRESGRYLLGATEIESMDSSPISVRSALELLSAAYAVQPAFAEARIVDTRVGRRPAYPDNIPLLAAHDGMLSINGMYRHGYLAGPALVEDATVAMGLRS